jgi:hypothetical protein
MAPTAVAAWIAPSCAAWRTIAPSPPTKDATALTDILGDLTAIMFYLDTVYGERATRRMLRAAVEVGHNPRNAA